MRGDEKMSSDKLTKLTACMARGEEVAIVYDECVVRASIVEMRDGKFLPELDCVTGVVSGVWRLDPRGFLDRQDASPVELVLNLRHVLGWTVERSKT